MSKVDFELLRKNLVSLQDLDLHIKHLLINKDDLKEQQSRMDRMESDIGKITDSLDAKINVITDDKSTISLSEQIASLQEQISALVAREPTTSSAGPSVGAEKLMVDISAQLEELCMKQTAHVQSSVSSSDPSHPPAPIQPEVHGRQFSHREEPVASSQDEFIDSSLESELISFLDSNKDKFKSEGGRLCLSFGEEYKYTGSRSAPHEVPPVIQSVIDKVNSELCADKPQMNSCFVNCFKGPSTSLPLHADNEMTIHPKSDIHTLSLGTPCTIRFAENQGTSTHDHSNSLG
jgi:hypothetical protein